MNIVQAIRDDHLFKPFLGDDQSSWTAWLAALRVVYGLRVHPRHKELVQTCTGRQRRHLPRSGFDTVLFVTGRRSGKSRMAAVVGAYEAALAGHDAKLAKGELGVVAVISPTRIQSRIVKTYLRAIFDAPLLHAEIVGEDQHGFQLRSGIRIDVLTGNFRTVRGHTLVAAIVDEAAFFGIDDESRVRSDTELIRAIKPGLATAGGRLIAITSPYAKRGWTYRTWKMHYGNEQSTTLVWNCPSRTMNPTLPQAVVDEAIAEDLQAAKSEYLGEFRDDVCEFLPRTLIESLVVKDRRELLPKTHYHRLAPDEVAFAPYFAFVDLSGGRHDDAALAIGHRSERKTVLDKLCRYRPPCNPHEVVRQMVDELRRFGVKRVMGDNYAAEFTSAAFRANGVAYVKSPLPKSALYLELLPSLCSGEVELLDDEALVNQLASLERRTRSGGKDVVDHPQGGHDDLANVTAGVVYAASKKHIRIGSFGK